MALESELVFDVLSFLDNFERTSCRDEPGGRLHCSDPVTRCLRRDMVQTASGMLYHLSGRLCKSTATEAGKTSITLI